MQILVLGSGSGGNCTLISTPRIRLLVDAGFGKRSTLRRLAEAGLEEADLDGILLTHGHWDHVRGAVSLAEFFAVPVFASEGTFGECSHLTAVRRREIFNCQTSFHVGDLAVRAFPVSHDASEPVGFRFCWRGIRGALITDLGEFSPAVLENLSGCDWLILESNHDEEMLKMGPYPWELKRRVLSRTGHLSNQAVELFLARQFDGAASHIFLAHLSRRNNHPELALESARAAVQGSSLHSTRGMPRIYLTHQDKPSIVLTL